MCPKRYSSSSFSFGPNLAMIGIYHFKDGAGLRREIGKLIDGDVRKGGEFQLPDALRALTEQGDRFLPGEVSAWMDCGNRKVTVETNGRVLEFMGDEAQVHDGATVEDSIILPPCATSRGTRRAHWMPWNPDSNSTPTHRNAGSTLANSPST